VEGGKKEVKENDEEKAKIGEVDDENKQKEKEEVKESHR